MENRTAGLGLGVGAGLIVVGWFLPWFTFESLIESVPITGNTEPGGHLLLFVAAAMVICAFVIGRRNAGLAGRNVALAVASESIIFAVEPFGTWAQLNRLGHDVSAGLGLFVCAAGAIFGTASVWRGIRTGARSPAEQIDLRTLLGSRHGRINRARYWTGTLVVSFVSSIGFATLPLVSDIQADDLSAYGWWSVIAMLALFYPVYAITAKRFQDRAKPGPLALLALVPTVVVAAVILLTVDGPLTSSAFLIVGLVLIGVIVLWLGIELSFLKGTDGPNRYGPDPLQADETQSSRSPGDDPPWPVLP